MKKRLLNGRDAILSILTGYTIYSLPIWVSRSAAAYVGIVAAGFCIFMLVSINEQQRQHCAGAKGRGEKKWKINGKQL